jgi:hypothetical protein
MTLPGGINMIGLHDEALGCDVYRHHRYPREYFWEPAPLFRLQMLDKDEGHARLVWKISQQLGKSFESTG